MGGECSGEDYYCCSGETAHETAVSMGDVGDCPMSSSHWVMGPVVGGGLSAVLSGCAVYRDQRCPSSFGVFISSSGGVGGVGGVDAVLSIRRVFVA